MTAVVLNPIVPSKIEMLDGTYVRASGQFDGWISFAFEEEGMHGKFRLLRFGESIVQIQFQCWSGKVNVVTLRSDWEEALLDGSILAHVARAFMKNGMAPLMEEDAVNIIRPLWLAEILTREAQTPLIATAQISTTMLASSSVTAAKISCAVIRSDDIEAQKISLPILASR